MLTLILKAQTNHFHHMDVEFRAEFKKMDERMHKVEDKFGILETHVDDRITKLETKIWNFQRWHVGIMVALFAGIYLKLFLGQKDRHWDESNIQKILTRSKLHGIEGFFWQEL